MTHITIKREVLEQAWVALNNAEDALNNSLVRTQHQITKETCINALEFVSPALAALRTALEAKGEEPYVWLYKDDMGDCQWFFTNPPEYSLPLYRHPAPDAREEKLT